MSRVPRSRVRRALGALLTGGLLVGVSPAGGQISLSGAHVFSSTHTGEIYGDQHWNTVGGDRNWNLYASAMADGTGLLNHGNAAGASLDAVLAAGENTFYLFGAPNHVLAYHGINLFFGALRELRISAFSPLGGSTFSASSASCTPGLVSGCEPASGALAFSRGGYTVELTDFYWGAPATHGRDVVQPLAATPDGKSDFVGRVTLTVSGSGAIGTGPSSVAPEPASMILLGSGLAGLVGAARRRRRS